MNVVAFIPARGGSKRVPGKNLREVNGRSLLDRAVSSAAACDACVVSTDDAVVASAALDARVLRSSLLATVHERPAHLATDEARVEDAIAHWLTEGHAPDVIVVLQPTSPLRTAEHVREALALMENTGADTVVSVCVSHTHHFAGRLKPREGPRDRLGIEAYSAAHVAAARDDDFFEWHSPRLPVLLGASRTVGYAGTTGAVYVSALTQDLAPIAHENGAIYAVTREHFLRHGLHGGRSVAYVMDPLDSIDVDTPRDLYLAAIYESVRDDERRYASGPNAAEWWAGMARDGIET